MRLRRRASPPDRYRSTVPVDVLLRTANRFLAELVGQRERGLLPAAIWLTPQITELRALRRIDAVQTEPLAADFDSVAIDYRGPPSDLRHGRHGQR